MKTAPAAHLDFVIIGAMKAGTTSLFEFLAAHPDVCAPRNKEPHYFTRGYKFPAAYYRMLFRHCDEQQLCGEASPTYSWVQAFPDTPARIASDAPDARLIYTIRDPLDRVLSHIRHQDLLGGPAGRVANPLDEPALWERSSYRTTIEAYLEHVPREQLLVVDLADMQADERWLRHILDYLGLDAGPLEPLSLPSANVSDERMAVPGFVSRIATTPVGSMVRDIVPRDMLDRLKRVVARRNARGPEQLDRATTTVGSSPGTPHRSLASITKDDLQAEKPAECAEIESQYRWARAEFIDSVVL